MTVTFSPDPEIFTDVSYFRIESIQNRLKELAYLISKLTITFQHSSIPEIITYHFPKGIVT